MKVEDDFASLKTPILMKLMLSGSIGKFEDLIFPFFMQKMKREINMFGSVMKLGIFT